MCFDLKWKVSATKVLDIAEDFDGSPDMVPAFHLLRDDDVTHLNGCEAESEDHEVEHVEKDDVESPPDDIVLRVEDVEDKDSECHHHIHG